MLQPNQPMGVPNQAATGPQAPKPQMPGMPQPGGQRPQQMPAGQMLSGVVGGGLGSILDSVGNAYAGNPQALEQKGVGGDLLAALAAQRLKAKMEAAKRELEMAASGQQQGQPQKTVVEQNEDALMELTKNEMQREQMDTLKQKQGQMQEGQKRLMQQAMQQPQPGIAGIPAPNAAEPKAMAAGGIVAFAGDTNGSYVTLNDEQFEIDPRTGKVKYKGVWTDPELIRQSQKSEWNTARRQPGADQEYKESTQGFLADLDKDFAAAKESQQKAYDAEMEGKPGYDWKGKFYPVNEQGKVMVNGVPTDPRVLQGATQRTYTAPKPAPTGPAAPAEAPEAGPQPGAKPAVLPGQRATAAPGLGGQQRPPVAPGGIAGPAGDSDAAFASRAARAAAETDPAVAAKAEREASYQFMKPADEDVAARRQGLASLQELTKQRFEPGQMADETLLRTLAGGAGRNWTTGAGMAQGYLGSKDAQYRQQRAALMGEDKYLADIMEDIAKPKKDAVAAGAEAMKQAGGIKQQGIQSIANIANEQLRQAVESSKAAAMHTANTLRQTELTEAKAQAEYRNILSEIDRRTKDIETKFGKEIGILAMREQAGALDDAGKQMLAKKRADMDIAIEALKDVWQPALDVAARKANIPVPSSAPASTGGGKVDTSNPLLAGKK